MSKKALRLPAIPRAIAQPPAGSAGSARSLFAFATALLLASVTGSAFLLDVRTASGAATVHRGIAHVALVLGVIGLLVGWRAWAMWARDSAAINIAAARFTWLHTVMSETNRLILRRPDPDALFAAVCRVCVESAEVELATISQADGGRSWHASAATDCTASDASSWLPGNEEGRLEMQRLVLELALRSCSVLVVRDVASDIRFRPWHAWCMAEEVRAVAAIPLHQGGVAFGMLCLYSKTREFFDDSLAPLLFELGSDISFALDNAERERERIAALIRTQRSDESNRSKSEFLARMSHELRTPLNAVLGFAQLLSRDTAPALRLRQAEWVQLILKAGWHLLALVDDVMDLTGIEAGRLHVQSMDFDAVPVVEEAIAFNQSLAHGRQVKLFASTLPRGRFIVLADANRLRQVLVNLISNACKYNRPGGAVHVHAVLEAENVVIEVVDDGPGMSEEQMAHLFEPFNRLGKENQDVEGTGIGLALSRQLVQMMNGTLEVESNPSGTLARVTLNAPALTQGQRAEPVLPPMKQPGESSVVLHIEDEPVNQLIVEQMLLKCGPVDLLEASTGKEGLRLAVERHPDLVLLDMNLPDMSGFEVLTELNANPDTKSLPVVAVSASALPQDILEAKNLGALDYWTKPLEFDSFVNGVKELLRTDA